MKWTDFKVGERYVLRSAPKMDPWYFLGLARAESNPVFHLAHGKVIEPHSYGSPYSDPRNWVVYIPPVEAFAIVSSKGTLVDTFLDRESAVEYREAVDLSYRVVTLREVR